MDHKYKLAGIILLSVISILLLAVSIGYYFVIPRKVDFSKYENQIRSVFERRIVYPSELGKLEIELTWNFRARVKTDRVSIKKLDGSRFIELGPSYMEVPILPLLSNRVVMKKVNINVLDANITRFDTGSFDVSSIFANVDKPKYKVTLNNAEMSINGYNVTFNDKFIQPSPKYLFIGEKLRIKNFTPGKYVKIQAIGQSFLNNKPDLDFDIFFESALPFLESNKFHIGGKLKNMRLNVLNLYLNGKVELEGSGDGAFDVEVYKKYFGKNKFFVDTNIKGLKVKTPKHGLISEHEGALKLITRGYYNENVTNLDSLNIEGEKIDIKGSGEIKKNDINFRLKIEDSQINSIARLFPKIYKIKLEPFKKILKHGTRAIVSGVVKLKGNPKKPNMYGKIFYKDLIIFKGLENTPEGIGRIDFVGPNLVLTNKIFMDTDSYTTISGILSPFKFKTLNMDIISTDMDFDKAHKILLVSQDFFNFKLGPVTKMDFKGAGLVNLNISGPFSDSAINGYVEGKGLGVKYEGFSKAANDVRGRLIFAGKKVYYDQIKAISDGMEILPSGFSTLKGYSEAVIHIPNLKLNKGLSFVNTSPLLIKAKRALKDVVVAGGDADAQIYLNGTDEDIKASGELLFKNGYVLYKGFGAPFENMNGVLKFEDEDVYFENLSGSAIGNKAKISGFIKGDKYSELVITSSSISHEKAREFVLKSPILKKAAELLNDYSEIMGKSAIEVNLKGNIEEDPFNYLILKDMNFFFNHKMMELPVYLNKGSLKITSDAVNVRNIQGKAEAVDFKANGTISNIKNYTYKGESLVPDFRLEIAKFDFSKFRSFVNAPLTPELVKKIFADFSEFHGTASVDLIATPKKYEFSIVPVNVSALYQPYDTFFLFNSGSVKVTSEGVDLKSLKGVVSESSFHFNGFANKNDFDLSTNISINSKDIAKFRFYSDIPLIANGIVPLSLELKGKPENWQLSGKMLLEKGSYISYLTDIGLPRNEIRVLSLEANGVKNRININRLGVDMGDKNLVSIYGGIDKINSSKPIFKDFIIKTSSENPIKTDLFNPSIGCVLDNGCENFFTSGFFKADLKLNGHVAVPEIVGSASFQDVAIPDYQTYVSLINFDFAKSITKIDLTGLRIGESYMNIAASMDNKLESPMLINDFHVNASMLNIDQLAKILPKGSGKELANLPPFVITNGSLSAGEMIVRNLITNNVKASFNFTPDWLISIPKISLIATNGIGQGSAFYNLKTTELSSGFKIMGMSANAVATTVLSLPNEVYGTVDSNIQFSTRGKNQQELIANSNGFAEFEVRKGHFTRLGSLEYLLRAVNVLHSGLGGFNLNNIIDLVSPQKTGHFEKLQGSVYVRNGVIYTEDLTSSGKNLSLFISGNIDMLTNKSDIQVLGRLSKKVSGMLGPVGSISINQFIDYIPGLGFLPTTPDRKGVIDLIPGLSKIPGLELADDKYRNFAVQINGNLYDQSSVRSFRWVE